MYLFSLEIGNLDTKSTVTRVSWRLSGSGMYLNSRLPAEIDTCRQQSPKGMYLFQEENENQDTSCPSAYSLMYLKSKESLKTDNMKSLIVLRHYVCNHIKISCHVHINFDHAHKIFLFILNSFQTVIDFRIL